MNIPVKPHFVRKGKAVYLQRELPLGFQNKRPIPAKTKGEVTSQGFEGGILKVNFWSHIGGTENVQFNELSAGSYLECDPYF